MGAQTILLLALWGSRTKLIDPQPPEARMLDGAIAQLGERLDRTQEVAGSSPASSTRKASPTRALPRPGLKMPTGWGT